MANPEWGVKRVCPETGKRFYDLNADPIVSPYTGKEYPLSFFTNDKSKTSMADKADKSALDKAKAEEMSDDVDVEVLDDEDDVTADADISDELLEDDDEDTVALEEIADVAVSDEEG